LVERAVGESAVEERAELLRSVGDATSEMRMMVERPSESAAEESLEA
jgi:hypothetical protein